MDKTFINGNLACVEDYENTCPVSASSDIKRAAAYCRVSTGMDVQDGSFETQCSYYRKMIEEDPYLTLVDIYADHGKSGRSMKGRKGLERLIRDCMAGKVDVVFTKSISRFARNLMECMELVRKLTDAGVAIIFEKEGINTADEAGELLLGILATIAQEESVSISNNMKWARRKHYEAGQPFEKASYGYRSVGEDHRWVVKAEEAKRVRLAFFMAGMCHSYSKISDALNSIEEQEGTGKKWSNAMVRYMLLNNVYVGDFLSNKHCDLADKNGMHRGINKGQADQFYIEDHHPALVNRKLFEAVGGLIGKGLLHSGRIRFTAEEEELRRSCIRLTKRCFAKCDDYRWFNKMAGGDFG